MDEDVKYDGAIKYRNQLLEKKKSILKVLKNWMANIENLGFINDPTLDKVEQNTTTNLIEILDKVTVSWETEIENGY